MAVPATRNPTDFNIIRFFLSKNITINLILQMELLNTIKFTFQKNSS